MKGIQSSFKIITEINGNEILERLEKAARTCYKSESQITLTSSTKLIRNIINRGHESVLEHEAISVRIICDRGISHELVRHRIGSYSQESTRYVNYQGKDMEFIIPHICPAAQKIWNDTMNTIENAYNQLINMNVTPQMARSVLPNSLKTELVMTLNLRSWRNFFKLRCAQTAHPQMREIAEPMLAAFKNLVPVVFEDL